MSGTGEEEEGKREGAAPTRVPSLSPPRPSVPSSHGGARTNYRIVVAAIWLAVQAALVVTAARRTDGPFDFRAQSESLVMKVVLEREVDGPEGRMRVHVDDGSWSARGRDGRYHRQSWYDRVPKPALAFDRDVPVAGGSGAQLARLQSALDDVARHLSTDDDVETRRLILDVTLRRNGRESSTVQLSSRERALGEPAARLGGP